MFFFKNLQLQKYNFFFIFALANKKIIQTLKIR